MTNVVMSKQDKAYQIDIVGHAGNSDVCRAVSTLGFTLMCAIDNEETKSKDISYKDGEVHITVEPTEESADHIDTIVRTIMLGFAMLEQGHPENVKLIM